MARSAIFHKGVICSLLDARMSEVFGAVYGCDGSSTTKRSEDRVCSIDAFLEGVEDGALFLGDGAILYRDSIESQCPRALFAPEAYCAPRASNVALEGLAQLASGASSDGAALDAVYLRKSQAEEARAASGVESDTKQGPVVP
jgi:tRNA A37 threonylcarbamoyladenosine modification protein TsaB